MKIYSVIKNVVNKLLNNRVQKATKDVANTQKDLKSALEEVDEEIRKLNQIINDTYMKDLRNSHKKYSKVTMPRSSKNFTKQ